MKQTTSLAKRLKQAVQKELPPGRYFMLVAVEPGSTEVHFVSTTPTEMNVPVLESVAAALRAKNYVKPQRGEYTHERLMKLPPVKK